MNANKLLRILIIAASALAFLVIALLLLRRPKPSATPLSAYVDIAEKIRIQRGSREILLWHAASGWDVSAGGSAARYRADANKVKAIIDALKALELEEVISERPENAVNFEVNPGSATEVSLLGKNDAALTAVALGKMAEDSIHIYVKLSDRPEVYLARGIQPPVLGTPDPLTWRDAGLWEIPEDQVITLFINGPGYKTALARSSDTWSMNGRILDPSPVWGMLGVLVHLKAEGFLPPGITPALSYASIAVQLKDGRTRQLRLGRPDPKTSLVPASVDGDPAIFQISSANAAAILPKPSTFPSKK